MKEKIDEREDQEKMKKIEMKRDERKIFEKKKKVSVCCSTISTASVCSTAVSCSSQRVGAMSLTPSSWVSVGTPVGPGKDTHGTLGPSQRKPVGGPNNSSAQQTVQIRHKHGGGTLVTRVWCARVCRPTTERPTLLRRRCQQW